MIFESFYTQIRDHVPAQSVAKRIYALAEEEKWNKQQYLPDRRISMLVSGIVRSSFTSGTGEDMTAEIFHQPGTLMFSMHEGTRLQAEQETVTLSVDLEALKTLAEQFPELYLAWSQLVSERIKRIREDADARNWLTGCDRYRWFLEHYEGCQDLVPSRHIAAFLGMWPESLSRVKKRVREQTRGPEAE